MILGIVQARVSSTRLPGKVLAPLAGTPMLERQLERVSRAITLDRVIVATSTDPSDDPLDALCAELGAGCFRGSLDDVLDRFFRAAETHSADHVVRLTGDCPLADPDIIDAVVRMHVDGGYDYTSNVCPPTFPDGLDVEVVTFEALARAHEQARLTSEHEHVTLWLRDHPELVSMGNFANDPDLSAMRWTVDEPADLVFVRAVYDALFPANPNFTMYDVLALLGERPELAGINARIERNEGLAKSIREDATRNEEE